MKIEKKQISEAAAFLEIWFSFPSFFLNENPSEGMGSAS